MNVKKLLYAIFGFILVLTFALGSLYFTKVKESRANEEAGYVICHHNPAQSITLEFQNEQAYLGHLGNPHNDQVYDTEGACEEDFDVCPLVQGCIDNQECLPELQEACEEEGEVEGFECEDLEEFCEVPHCTLFPNDEECQEPEPGVCKDEAALNYKEEGECEYPNPTPPSEPTPEPERPFFPAGAPQPPSCVSPTWAPTLTFNGTEFVWTEVKDGVNTYWMDYGPTADNLVYSVLVEGESFLPEVEWNGHIWARVAASDQGCLGPFSLTVDP